MPHTPRISAPFVSRFAPLALGLLASAAAAQKGADLVLCDSTHDQLLRLTDVDGDGDYNSANEVLVLYTDGAGGTNQSLPRSAEARIEGDLAGIFWLDTQGDVLWRGRDLNGNGLIDAGEQNKYRDMASLDGPTSPDGLELLPDGSVWWCSDIFSFSAPARGLLRLFDRNFDGDCNDALEQFVLINGGQPFSAASDFGSVPVDAAAFTTMTRSGKGVVVFSAGDSEAFFRFEDLNADNDLVDAGEARLFLVAAALNGALPQNPDFANGALPSLQVAKTTGLEWARMSQISSRIEGATWAYYITTDIGATSAQALNVNGGGINGLVFRAVDANQDGDVNDAGEVRLFYDGSVTSTAPVKLDRIAGIDVKSGEIYLADSGFGSSAVHRLEDKNADGDARDPGEVQGKRFDYSTHGGGSLFFFGNPFLEDIAVVPTNVFGGNWQLTGTACAPVGFLPKLSYSGAAKLGTNTTQILLQQGSANSEALLYFGTSTTAIGGLPLPLDVAAFGFPGCTLYQDLVTAVKLLTSPSGNATFNLVIPNDLSLDGALLASQWLVSNTQVVPQGLAFSALGELLLTN